jgi:hypothetical protein
MEVRRHKGTPMGSKENNPREKIKKCLIGIEGKIQIVHSNDFEINSSSWIFTYLIHVE